MFNPGRPDRPSAWPPAREQAGPGPRPGGGWQPTPRWQEPPTPPTNWSYVDSIRTSELVPTRKPPPGRGWRRAVYKATFGTVNLGQSPDELRQAALEARIRSLLRGHYKIGVLGKGGMGRDDRSRCRFDPRRSTPGRPCGRHRCRHIVRQAGQPRRPARRRFVLGAGGRRSPRHVRRRAQSRRQQLRGLVRPHQRPRRPRAAGCSTRRSTREAAARLDRHFADLDHGLQLDHGQPGHPGRCSGSRRADRGVVAVGGRRRGGRADHGVVGQPRPHRAAAPDRGGAQRLGRTCRQAHPQHPSAAVRQPRPGGDRSAVRHASAAGRGDRRRDRVSPKTRRKLFEIAAAIAEHFVATTDAPRERR